MAANITLRDYEEADREITWHDEKLGFRIHLTVYLLVNILLFGINMVIMNQTSSDFLWFFFPLVGWGIGLAAHYVYGIRFLEEHIAERQHRVETLAAHRIPM